MNTILYKGEQYIVYTVRRYSQPMELELTRVFCVPSRYPDGTLAVTLRREEAPHGIFAVITRELTRMGNVLRPQQHQAYLDTKGCVGWLLPFLLENGLADTCRHCVNTAFDNFPLWEFRTEKFRDCGLPVDTAALKEFAPDIPAAAETPPPPTMDDMPPAMEDIPPAMEQEFLPPPPPTEEDMPADLFQQSSIFDMYGDLPE